MPSDRWRERVEAAKQMDWVQVALHQGKAPCFYLERDPEHADGRFCGRADFWSGHTDKDEWPEHRFVSLRALIEEVEREALEKAALLGCDYSGCKRAIRALAQSKEKTDSAWLNQYPLSVVAEACTPKMEKTDGE